MSEAEGGWTEAAIQELEERLRAQQIIEDERKMRNLAKRLKKTPEELRRELQDKIREDYGELSEEDLNHALVQLYESHNLNLDVDPDAEGITGSASSSDTVSTANPGE